MNDRLEFRLGVLLIAAGFVSAMLYAFVFVDPTTPKDWADGAAWVRERAKPRDIIRIEPHWQESALIELRPVGAQVQRISRPLLEDMHGGREVLILSETGRVDDALAVLPFDAKPAEQAAFGGVTALRIEMPESPFIWELAGALETTAVSRVHGDQVQRCNRWNKAQRRWDCDKPNRWLYVGQVEREVGDEPRQCVWAHPLDGGRTLRIEVDVPPARTIRVRDSLDLRGARLGGADMLVQIFINDELRVEDRVAGNDHDWQAHEIDVSGLDGPVRLRIEVDVLGKIKDRFLCLNAWALK